MLFYIKLNPEHSSALAALGVSKFHFAQLAAQEGNSSPPGGRGGRLASGGLGGREALYYRFCPLKNI